MLRAATIVLCSTLSLSVRPFALDATVAKDPCPHLIEAAAHSSIRDITVPYRIVNTTHGLGLFALHKIHKGEVVMVDTRDQFVRLTPDNWRQVAKLWIQHHAWKALPGLDAAYKRLMSKGDKEVPEQMLAVFLRNFQSHLQVYNGKEHGTKRSYVTLVIADDVYTNSAKVLEDDKIHENDEEEDYVNDEDGPALEEEEKDPLSLAEKEESFLRAVAEIKDSRLPYSAIDRAPALACKDIEPCTEILEDYDWSGDNEAFPDWIISVLKKHGGITKASGILEGFDDDMPGIHANIDW